MTEAEWLAADSPHLLRDYLFRTNEPDRDVHRRFLPVRTSARKIRLAGAALLRAVWNSLTAPFSKLSVVRLESIAKGEAAAYPERGTGKYDDPMGILSEDLYWVLNNASVCAMTLGASRKSQAELIREVVGNPFRPVKPWVVDGKRGPGGQIVLPPPRVAAPHVRHLYEWQGGLVLSLATAAYEHRWLDGVLNPARLMVLADLLEEAGCQKQCDVCHGSRQGHDNNGACGDCEGSGWVEHHLLIHLREPGPHVRGCWALGLVRGLE